MTATMTIDALGARVANLRSLQAAAATAGDLAGYRRLVPLELEVLDGMNQAYWNLVGQTDATDPVEPRQIVQDAARRAPGPRAEGIARRGPRTPQDASEAVGRRRGSVTRDLRRPSTRAK